MLLSVKTILSPSHIVVAEVVKDAIGGAGDDGTDNVISSTAKEGSVPTLSSLLTHLNPIFTFALLFAEAGNAIEYVVHKPWPEPHVDVLTISTNKVHVEPS